MKNLHFLVDTVQQMHKGDRDVIITLSAVSAHPDFDVKLPILRH
jgi:hypothetical protein